MNQNKFQPDKKLFTICIYALITTVVAVFFIRCIWNWSETKSLLLGLLSSLSPFLLGFFIAYIMGNLSSKLENRFFTNTIHISNVKVRKMVALISSYVIVFGMLILALFFIIPSFIQSISDIAGNISTIYQNFINYIEEISSKYPNSTVEYVQAAIQDAMPSYLETFKSWAANLAPSIANASISIVRWVLNFIVAIIVSIYMLLDKDILSRSFKRIVYSIFRKERAIYVWSTFKHANDIFSGFIIGKTIDSLIIGIICLLGMKLFNIGSSYAVIVSIFVGLTNMIPYFGPFIGAIPSILVISLSVSPKQGFAFLIFVIILQQFDGNILGPKILGDKTGLRPIWIIFAITVGGWIGGIVGMFLGVPCVAVISSILDDIVEHNLEKQNVNLPKIKHESNSKSFTDYLKILSNFMKVKN
ncbi:AI-2E family transporter [uncultured Eubacterium sp.]|uniref:AI-2E family transporter n=1 Tax=uncultured Eubacterium sp. TaxID=165185 RepID=UPI003264BDF0